MANNGAGSGILTRGDFDGIEILEEGIRLLCENDPEAESIIAPRSGAIIQLLCAYIAEIELFNPACGLVGTGDRKELIVRHILDSLAPLGIFCRILKEQSSAGIPAIADAGSGAGLPGIPLAIALPRVKFTLIERMKRRADFLRHTQKTLALSNVTVTEDETEKFAHKLIMKDPSASNRFALVIFRAFRALEPKIIRGLFRLCAGTGILAAYKGKRARIDEEIAALEQYAADGKPKFQLTGCEVISCPTPLLDEERHILLIRGSA
jgi:16S rRNA (guanine527-N7)-methyltransferase